MVLFSPKVLQDLDQILEGLLSWSKHQLEYDHVVDYHNELKTVCNSLDTLSIHLKAKYTEHKLFGTNVFKYRRNKQTIWYIIYNYDHLNNIVYVNHIVSNHTTTEAH